MEIDLQDIFMLTPGSELFIENDHTESVVSYPVSHLTAVEMHDNGEIYFRQWDMTHALSDERELPSILPEGYTTEQIAAFFMTQVRIAEKSLPLCLSDSTKLLSDHISGKYHSTSAVTSLQWKSMRRWPAA